MSNPRYLKFDRDETMDTVVVASAFALVALALASIIYAYSDPEAQVKSASNLPPLTDIVSPAQAAQ
jgi:hypothetical protein